jgi:hypothetical protein
MHKIRNKTANYAPCDVVLDFAKVFFTFKIIYGFVMQAQM